MNYYPNLPDVGTLALPKSKFNWSSTTIVAVILALFVGGYTLYHYFLKPLETKDSKLDDKKIDPLKVMANRDMVV